MLVRRLSHLYKPTLIYYGISQNEDAPPSPKQDDEEEDSQSQVMNSDKQIILDTLTSL